MLENHYSDNDSAYRRLYTESLSAFLEEDGPDAVNFAKLLDAIDGPPCLVETSMRKAGFILGFESCRQLLLGDLDLDGLKDDSSAAAKGGAR